jgi:hypothetical protein
MKVKTGFYFIGWMFKRLCRTLFRLPLKLHRTFMNTYQDHRGLGFFAWFLTSMVVIFLLGAVGLSIGDTNAESVSNFKTIVTFGYSIAVTYLITCVILDQYEKFENERMASWHTLKD